MRPGKPSVSGIAALATTALLACKTAPPASPVMADSAADSCVIAGGPKSPAEVRIYESYPYGSPGGRRLFIGLLNFGEQQRIQSPTGRIWYAYRWHEGDTWKDGHDVTCRDGQRVELP